MRRLLVTLVLCALFAAAGAASMSWFWFHRDRVPDPPSLVTQMREVARLETLDVMMYKKVSFEPEPTGELWDWAKSKIYPDHGKAIVFADVHLGLSFRRLDTDHLQVHGETIDVVLPPIEATVELKPGDTEVINSNLDSQQTTQLLQSAKEAFEREAMRDPKLQSRAKESAQRALKGFLLSVGFRKVNFVETIPRAEPG